MTSCNANSLLQVQLNMSSSSSFLDGRKSLAPSLASSNTADMPNVSLDPEDGLGTAGALSPEKDKASKLQEVKGRQHDAELVSVAGEKEQTDRLASLEEVAATKADNYCVLEQERSTAAQTRQELALEQKRSAEMAASIQRLEQEKMEVTASAEKQKQEHESNLSRMTVVVEGLQEQTNSLKANLVKGKDTKEGAESEAASLRTRCSELSQEVSALQESVSGWRLKSEEVTRVGEAAAKEADRIRDELVLLRIDKSRVEGELAMAKLLLEEHTVHKDRIKTELAVQTDRLAGVEAELRATEQSRGGVSGELGVARGQVERLYEEQEGGRRPGGAWKRAGRSWWGRWRSSGRGWGRRPLPGRRSRAGR